MCMTSCASHKALFIIHGFLYTIYNNPGLRVHIIIYALCERDARCCKYLMGISTSY